jgi:hypothetical protein
VRGQSLLSLWSMAVCAWLLLRWYAIMLTALRFSIQPSEASCQVLGPEVSLAIRLVERYYTGHQPRFMQWFCKRFQAELLALWVLN